MPVYMRAKDRGGCYVLLEMRSLPELNSLSFRPRIHLSLPPPPALGLQAHRAFLTFLHGSWDLNSDLHECTASALPTGLLHVTRVSVT